MAGRKPDEGERKDVRLEIRLNEEQSKMLIALSEYYGISKAKTIIKAIKMLNAITDQERKK